MGFQRNLFNRVTGSLITDDRVTKREAKIQIINIVQKPRCTITEHTAFFQEFAVLRLIILKDQIFQPSEK